MRRIVGDNGGIGTALLDLGQGVREKGGVSSLSRWPLASCTSSAPSVLATRAGFSLVPRNALSRKPKADEGGTLPMGATVALAPSARSGRGSSYLGVTGVLAPAISQPPQQAAEGASYGWVPSHVWPSPPPATIATRRRQAPSA